MEVHWKSSFSLAFLVMMLLIAHSRAISLKSNGSKRCNGPIHECEDLELKLLMDTEINIRILADGKSSSLTLQANVRAKAPGNCGRGVPYKSCLDKKIKCRDPHDRGCHPYCGINKGSKCSF
ncbi:hypothetical protein L1049_002003 [Liquidambar formosana]|uniref:Uncharacterized protein n=1 Tax=Liquidambar formosana TaxID=63359 RepID=A0AAP0NGY6_LIQFO